MSKGTLIERSVYPSGMNDEQAYWNQYDRVIKTCDAVFMKDDHVYKIYSQLHTGENRYSGKRYFRWQNNQIQGIKRHPSTGNIIAYAWVGKKNVGPQSTWVTLSRDYNRGSWQTGPDAFQRTVKEVLGISHWHDVYPVAKYYKVDQYYSVPSSIIGAFRAETSREFVERLFGKRAYRKDLLKAVGSTNIYNIHYVKGFKGLVPIDWIINFLRLNNPAALDPTQWGYSFYRDPRRVLTQIDPRSYRHLLHPEAVRINDFYLMEDTVRFIEQNGFQDEEGARYYRSWQDIHDRNMPRYTHSSISKFEDCEINLLPIAEALNGLTTKSFEIVPASHTSQLTEWGQAMHNCIGGYRSMAAKGNAILGAVYSNGKLTANFELGANKKLKQLLGPRNKPLGKNQRAELEAAFKSKGVDVNGYWGKNDELY